MGKYDDIINLNYVKSKNHPHMSLSDRASQFAPFAALNGYEESIKETSRTTSSKKELLQEDKDIISAKLLFIKDHKLDENIIITYFVKDLYKKGGKYITTNKVIKSIDDVYKKVYFTDNTYVLLDDIYDIKSYTIDSIFIDF